jgi:hypothetical protein
LRDELLSLTTPEQAILRTNSKFNCKGSFAWKDAFSINDALNTHRASVIRVRTTRLSESTDAAFKRTLVQAANDAAIIDAAIIRLIKLYTAKKDVPVRKCSVCLQQLDLSFYSFNQLNKRSDVSKCKLCIAKETKRDPPAITPMSGVQISVLFETTSHFVRQRLHLSQNMFHERIRRLVDEGCIRVNDGNYVVYVTEDEPAAVASQISQQPEVSQVRTSRQVSRKLSHADSISLEHSSSNALDDDAIEPEPLQRLISAADSSTDQTFLQLASDLDFLPDSIGQIVFVPRSVVLEDAKSILAEISACLGDGKREFSRARALSLLSDTRVRWSHRAVSSCYWLLVDILLIFRSH